MKQNEALSESYFYILLCLAIEPSHGYGIMQQTERLSGGEVRIGSGTMYGATSNMIKKGWIEELLSAEASGERRRLYSLTPIGREALHCEIERLKKMVALVKEVRV